MLKLEEIQIIQGHQKDSIARKTLVSGQLELIYDRNWFNIWVPKPYGGEGKSLPEGTALLEELAYWDGSLAWTITLCSGANMFAGFIDETLAKAVFSDRKVCLGGSGRVGGKAVWDGKQYVISGEWQYATGAPHLTHFTLNSLVYHGDKQQFDDTGNPLVYSFFVPKDDVLIHYDWDTFGLESTASHSFSLINKAVAPSYSFQLKSSLRVSDEPLFRIPFRPFADVTLLVNYVGMYRRFLDLVYKYFFDKSKDPVWEARYSKPRFRALDSYQQQLERDRSRMRELIGRIWDQAVMGNIAEDDDTVREIYQESRDMVKRIREGVSALFPLVGIVGAQREQELNIVFRNIFTATQHSLLNIPMEE